ncbi:hypothetical protein ACFX2I_006265 [Malus domestica]
MIQPEKKGLENEENVYSVAAQLKAILPLRRLFLPLFCYLHTHFCLSRKPRNHPSLLLAPLLYFTATLILLTLEPPPLQSMQLVRHIVFSSRPRHRSYRSDRQQICLYRWLQLKTQQRQEALACEMSLMSSPGGSNASASASTEPMSAQKPPPTADNRKQEGRRFSD